MSYKSRIKKLSAAVGFIAAALMLITLNASPAAAATPERFGLEHHLLGAASGTIVWNKTSVSIVGGKLDNGMAQGCASAYIHFYRSTERYRTVVRTMCQDGVKGFGYTVHPPQGRKGITRLYVALCNSNGGPCLRSIHVKN